MPLHSARIELCKPAVKDPSVTGAAYREMVNSVIGKIAKEKDTELVRS